MPRLRDLSCNRLEIDEVLGFIGKKESRLRPGDDPKQPKRSVTVLKIPPAVSPETAVRVAIMQELRDAEAAEA